MDLLGLEGTRLESSYADTHLTNLSIQNENADDWSYQVGLEGGWIPQDPTDRIYPGICG